MRVTYNNEDDRAGLRGYVQCNKYTHMHIHTAFVISIMDCVVMCNLLYNYTYTYSE